MDDIKMIGLKDASDATSSLPANCGMYYSIHYDLSDGQVLVREHADGNNYTSFASKSIAHRRNCTGSCPGPPPAPP